MSLEYTVLIVIIAGAILHYLLRRLSEEPPPRIPPGDVYTRAPETKIERGGDRIAITHPLIRRAAERALARGGEAAKYVVREEDQLYFSFESLEDPADRQRALDLLARIQSSQEADMSELLWLVRRVFKE